MYLGGGFRRVSVMRVVSMVMGMLSSVVGMVVSMVPCLVSLLSLVSVLASILRVTSLRRVGRRMRALRCFSRGGDDAFRLPRCEGH